MLSAVIEGIDFPAPFGAHRRATIRGVGFQKTSSSALIIWSIISIKTMDLQQSLLQCLHFLSSIGLQICWVKVILTDQKVNSEQELEQPLGTVVRSRSSHYKKNVTVSLLLLSTHTLHGPLASKLTLAYMTRHSETQQVTSLLWPNQLEREVWGSGGHSYRTRELMGFTFYSGRLQAKFSLNYFWRWYNNAQHSAWPNTEYL